MLVDFEPSSRFKDTANRFNIQMINACNLEGYTLLALIDEVVFTRS